MAIPKEVLDLFEYDPFSPTFLTNATTRGSRALEGAPAGTRGKGGYTVKINKEYYQNSRIIWEKLKGPVPEGYIVGFEDGDCHNADIRNLFLQDNRQRMWGCHFETNKTGYRGVSRKKLKNGTIKYTASIKVRGEQMYLGSYDTAPEAWLAYKAANKGLRRAMRTH